MADFGALYADRAGRMLEIRLQRLFTEAQSDVLKKLDSFTKKYEARDKQMQEKLAKGLITEEKYKRWVAGQVFQGAQWEQKVKDINASLRDHYADALDLTYQRQLDVFSKNHNYQAYCLEHDIGKSFGFDLCDVSTVERLVKDTPELLPRKVVNRKHHNHWNQGIINNCITQGVIQGESIKKIAERIANTTANHNLTSATLYARTAMTSAQNGGRMEMLREAKEMGINVKKQWLATSDGRTRDSHRNLNGKIMDVSKPFISDFGKIDFPGDPKADPADVYNCRCTLVYVFPDHEDMSQYKDWEEAKKMTYPEWEEAKEQMTYGSGERPIEKYLQPDHESEEDHRMSLYGFKKIAGEHSIMDDAKAVNPLYDPNNFATSNNCQRCVNAYVARRRGYDVKARGIHDTDDHYAIGHNFKECYDTDEKVKHIALSIFEKDLTTEIARQRFEKEMLTMPDGAIAIISGYWDITNTGHVFIAEKVNGSIMYVDPQIGKECGFSWGFMQPKSLYWFRADDKPFNSKIAELVEGV